MTKANRAVNSDAAMFGRRVRALRLAAGLGQREFAEAARLPNQTSVVRLEAGRLRGIAIDGLYGLIALARRQGIPAAEFLLGVRPGADLTDEQLRAEQARRVAARVLREAGMEVIDAGGISGRRPVEAADLGQWELQFPPPAAPARRGYETVPAEDVPSSPDWWRHYVPVLGGLAAGSGIDAAEAAEYPPGWAGEFLRHEGAPPTAVAVRVVGTSMQPQYQPGDMVVVDPSRQAEAGSVCCVMLDVGGRREPRLKRLELRGKSLVLKSLNPQVADEEIPRDRLAGAYPVVAHLPLIVGGPEGGQR